MVHIFFICKQLNLKTVQFQTIQFSISTQFFVCKQLNLKIVQFQTIQFSISTQYKYQTVLFAPQIEPYQMLQLQARMSLGAMTIKGHVAFPQTPTLLQSHHKICSIISRTHFGWVLPLSRDTGGMFCRPSSLGPQL